MGAPLKITPKLEKQVLSMTGMKYAKIAKEVGLAESSISRIMLRNGIKRSLVRISPEIEEKIIELGEDGVLYKDIKEATGCSMPQISQVLKRNGIVRKRRNQSCLIPSPYRMTPCVCPANKDNGEPCRKHHYQKKFWAGNLPARVYCDPCRERMGGYHANMGAV